MIYYRGKERLDRNIFINRVSKTLENGYGAIFVGSGISWPSTRVDWFDLLKPLAEELNLILDSKIDDLPLIAQYIVNNYSGNRGPLVNEIRNTFNRDFKLNSYHRCLSKTKVSTIWTTNYDRLLEKAFSNFNVCVKVDDDSLRRTMANCDIEIIKIHGCCEKSKNEEIIITQEDYEDIEISKPGIYQRLCEDFCNKSFLFIGYSYRDPDIRNIMIDARRLCKKQTREHFMILKRIASGGLNDQEVIRQKLWCNDIKRVGISTLLIDSYDELESVLEEISIRSRGKTVYVTGSHHSDKNNDVLELGKLLAKEKEVILLSGQSSGIGALVLSGFTEVCVKEGMDIINRIKVFPNPYSIDKKYSDDPSLIPDLKRHRFNLLNSARVVIVFSGGIGTEAEVEVAFKQNCEVIPVILAKSDRDNQAIKKVFDNVGNMEKIKDKDENYYKRLMDKNDVVTIEEVMICIENVMR